MTTSHHRKNTTNVLREFYKLPLFRLLCVPSETAPKTWKFDPIPLVPLDQINFISTLSRLVDREGPTTKQLYSHARALDVLIATLFKRLYNFQSFLMRFALVARCGNYLSILRDFARDPKACLTRNKNLSKHKTDFAVEWMDGYFGESSKVINTVVVFFRVRAKSAKSKS